MELLKPSRFNADKCINVLMGTRNAATCILGSNASAWSAKTQQEFSKCCKGRLGSLDKGTGAQQGKSLCKQVLTPTQNASHSPEVLIKSLN